MFIKNTLTIFVIIVNCLIIIESTKIAKKIVIIEGFGICPDQKQEDMKLKILSKRYGMASGSNSILAFSGEILEPINGTLLANATVYRCSNLHDEGDCERILFITVREICHKITETNQAWSFIFSNLKPPLLCPIQPGYYEMKRGQPDYEKLKWLVDDYHVFKAYINIFEEQSNDILVCLYAVVRAAVVREWLKD